MQAMLATHAMNVIQAQIPSFFRALRSRCRDVSWHPAGPDDYKTSEDLVNILVNNVALGGVLILNIGPASDGTIRPIQQERYGCHTLPVAAGLRVSWAGSWTLGAGWV